MVFDVSRIGEKKKIIFTYILSSAHCHANECFYFFFLPLKLHFFINIRIVFAHLTILSVAYPATNKRVFIYVYSLNIKSPHISYFHCLLFAFLA